MPGGALDGNRTGMTVWSRDVDERLTRFSTPQRRQRRAYARTPATHLHARYLGCPTFGRSPSAGARTYAACIPR